MQRQQRRSPQRQGLPAGAQALPHQQQGRQQPQGQQQPVGRQPPARIEPIEGASLRRRGAAKQSPAQQRERQQRQGRADLALQPRLRALLPAGQQPVEQQQGALGRQQCAERQQPGQPGGMPERASLDHHGLQTGVEGDAESAQGGQQGQRFEPAIPGPASQAEQAGHSGNPVTLRAAQGQTRSYQQPAEQHAKQTEQGQQVGAIPHDGTEPGLGVEVPGPGWLMQVRGQGDGRHHPGRHHQHGGQYSQSPIRHLAPQIQRAEPESTIGQADEEEILHRPGQPGDGLIRGQQFINGHGLSPCRHRRAGCVGRGCHRSC